MQHLIRLDARLSLAYDLYDPCTLAADIGTDHAHLPAALLQRGRRFGPVTGFHRWTRHAG